ncbi:kinase-like domain-containing protein [Hyaloraphidium curvatum]|nr:kinase-like domain-containing protein [Hyaloraphidium curvatum]
MPDGGSAMAPTPLRQTPPPCAPDARPPPARLGPWRLTGRALGAGSFGTVFEAVHRQTGQRAAVKRARLASPEAKAELDALAAVAGHPNVVALLGAFDAGDHTYIVLEHIDGTELFHAVARAGGKLPEPAVRAVLRQVLAALAHVHSRGWLHRDVKLDNIMVSADGGVKLIDFGLACRYGPGTVFREAVGSVRYAAPTVLEYMVAEVPYTPDGGWIDVYAAAVCLWGALHGVFPHRPSLPRPLFMDILAAHSSGPLRLPSPPGATASREASACCAALMDCRARPTAEEALAHPWLSGIHPGRTSDSSSGSDGRTEARDKPLPALPRAGTPLRGWFRRKREDGRGSQSPSPSPGPGQGTLGRAGVAAAS